MNDEARQLEPGLYLVATPIGNLGDITLRALDVLRAADRIACEDTRQTQKLLNHFEIAKPTVSCHEHNERERAAEFVEAIRTGAKIAVVSDAGMPGVSDPGTALAQAVIAAGLQVIPIPGPNAALSALVASGMATSEFTFLGFLPEKTGARRTRLELLAKRPRENSETVIFYEAPHRIVEMLADLEAVWGPQLRVAAARELTKMHEEFLRGAVSEVRRELESRDRVRGEFTVVVEVPAASQASNKPHESLAERVVRLQTETGIDEKEALKRLARELGQSKSEVYRELQRERARKK